MENLQSWAILAGVLVAAVAMYALAWRIVEGTHIVVRAVTRILLGALIVVPAILFIVFGDGAPMSEKASAPAPKSASQSEDVAKPAKKSAAPVPERNDDKEEAARAAKDSQAEEQRQAAETQAEVDAAKRQAEAGARRAEAERIEAAEAEARQRATEAEQARMAAEADARRKEAETERALESARRQVEEQSRTSAANQTSGGEAAAPIETEPADRSAQEPAMIENPSATGAAPHSSATRRYYKRSYQYRPPAAANGGGGSGGSSAGGGFGGLAAPAPEPPTVPSTMPDVSAPDAAPGAGATAGAAAPEAAAVAPDVAAVDTAPLEEAERAPEVAAMEAAPPSSAPPGAAAAPTAADQVKEDWAVVPVFYGTDRARADQEKRIGYDWQRGRRMELGHALVTIPKEHVVPMVERPWALKIPYVDIVLYEAAEDPKKHFTMKELKALTREEFLSLVKERLQRSARFKDHALVFIHGYKTKFDNAIYRTAQIAYDLKFDGAPFLYSWPSGGTLQGYTYDRESAAQAENYLRQFLEMVRDETGAKKVSIIAHSMGNQLLLRTLQDMRRNTPDGLRISQLILAAPDVDRDSFEHIVRAIEGIAEGITLYAASNDTALSFSRRVNGGIPRAGDVPEEGPIVMEGIDTIDATATSMDSVGINHSGYAENNALLEDIGKLVSAGIRPPGIRLPSLERIETDKGPYWRYPMTQP